SHLNAGTIVPAFFCPLTVRATVQRVAAVKVHRLWITLWIIMHHNETHSQMMRLNAALEEAAS
ncbi:MAG: hypothetical protein PVF06_12925, partial [Gammaproteobacteria bacterium]